MFHAFIIAGSAHHFNFLKLPTVYLDKIFRFPGEKGCNF